MRSTTSRTSPALWLRATVQKPIMLSKVRPLKPKRFNSRLNKGLLVFWTQYNSCLNKSLLVFSGPSTTSFNFCAPSLHPLRQICYEMDSFKQDHRANGHTVSGKSATQEKMDRQFQARPKRKWTDNSRWDPREDGQTIPGETQEKMDRQFQARPKRRRTDSSRQDPSEDGQTVPGTTKEKMDR